MGELQRWPPGSRSWDGSGEAQGLRLQLPPRQGGVGESELSSSHRCTVEDERQQPQGESQRATGKGFSPLGAVQPRDEVPAGCGISSRGDAQGQQRTALSILICPWSQQGSEQAFGLDISTDPMP